MGRSDGHRVKLRYLHYSTSQSGERYYFLRRNGKRTPLGKGPIDSPDFLVRYAEALKASGGPQKAVAGSLRGVCEAFERSTSWAAYSKSYQGTLTRHIRLLCNEHGDLPFRQIQPKHIQGDLDKLSPHAAANRLKTWRNLCAFAQQRGWHTNNPASLIKRATIPKTEGHARWTPEDIKAYRDQWPTGTVQRLCFEVLYWTGARTVDAVKLTPSMVENGVLEFVQQKTGGKAYVPWTSPLPAWAAPFAEDRRHLLDNLQSGVFTFLETRGRARSRKGLSNVIAAAARKAGINKTAHGLRKARLTQIAEAGGSAHAIMAWGGHKTMSEAQEYVREADARRLVVDTRQSQSVHKGQ